MLNIALVGNHAGRRSEVLAWL